jgi:hypothetical protein
MFPPVADDSAFPEIDPIGITDTFTEGLSSIEHLGPCRRLKFMTLDRSSPRGPVKIVVERLIMPSDALLRLARAILADEHAAEPAIVRLQPNASMN